MKRWNRWATYLAAGAVLSVLAASSVSAQPRPRDRLTSDELAVMREIAGKPSTAFYFDDRVRPAIDRVYYAVADRSGFYGGDTWSKKPSTGQTFYSRVFSGVPSRLVDDRFLVTGGCDFSTGLDACWQSGSMAIDLTTGHVAVAIIHRFNDRGTIYYERGHLTIFMRACADPALQNFARTHFPAWARAEFGRVYREDVHSVDKPSILTSRCT